MSLLHPKPSPPVAVTRRGLMVTGGIAGCALGLVVILVAVALVRVSDTASDQAATNRRLIRLTQPTQEDFAAGAVAALNACIARPACRAAFRGAIRRARLRPSDVPALRPSPRSGSRSRDSSGGSGGGGATSGGGGTTTAPAPSPRPRGPTQTGRAPQPTVRPTPAPAPAPSRPAPSPAPAPAPSPAPTTTAPPAQQPTVSVPLPPTPVTPPPPVNIPLPVPGLPGVCTPVVGVNCPKAP